MKNKNTKKKLKKYQWVFTLIITVFVAMYVYGMTTVYFPDPIHLGFGQYLEVSVGIVIIALLLSGVILTFIFKKGKRG